MAKREVSRIRTTVLRLCGHWETGPNGVVDQSCARIRRAISPSPAMIARFNSSSECLGPLTLWLSFDYYSGHGTA